jgi:hypothetical protein
LLLLMLLLRCCYAAAGQLLLALLAILTVMTLLLSNAHVSIIHLTHNSSYQQPRPRDIFHYPCSVSTSSESG